MTAAFEEATAMGGETRQQALWLSGALWTRLDVRCEWLAGHRLSQVMLRSAEKHEDPELAACGLLLHGRSEATLGHYELASTYFDRALVAWRNQGNVVGVVLALVGLGVVEERDAQPARALLRYADALDLARRSKLNYVAAVILSNMSMSYTVLGQLDRAAAAGKESVTLTTAHEMPPCPVARINLAGVHVLLGHLTEAVRYADEALVQHEQTGEWSRVCPTRCS